MPSIEAARKDAAMGAGSARFGRRSIPVYGPARIGIDEVSRSTWAIDQPKNVSTNFYIVRISA